MVSSETRTARPTLTYGIRRCHTPPSQTLDRHPKALCRLIETSETYCVWTSHLLSPVFFLEFQLASYCFLRYKEIDCYGKYMRSNNINKTITHLAMPERQIPVLIDATPEKSEGFVTSASLERQTRDQMSGA
jgi:hypothetical protein